MTFRTFSFGRKCFSLVLNRQPFGLQPMVLSSVLQRHGRYRGNVILDFSDFFIWQKMFHTGIEPPTSRLVRHGHIHCATETWKMLQVESVEIVECERPLIENVLHCVLEPLQVQVQVNNRTCLRLALNHRPLVCKVWSYHHCH